MTYVSGVHIRLIDSLITLMETLSYPAVVPDRSNFLFCCRFKKNVVNKISM